MELYFVFQRFVISLVEMPRRRTLTGRVERGRDRKAQYSRRNTNVNTSANIGGRVNANLIIDLIDNFKVAWNEVPFNFQSHGCGEMNLICFRCNAQHFEGEVTGGSRNLFTSCCHKGKVFLEGLSDNNFFKGLYDDLISNNLYINTESTILSYTFLVFIVREKS